MALKLYDEWVDNRQRRPDFLVPQSQDDMSKVRARNFSTQLAAPRRKHLEALREVAKSMDTPDIVALLAMTELPSLEISTLLRRLRDQLTRDQDAVYFSPENMADNCGCGCGCGCGFMMRMPYEERLRAHLEAKPFSVDPFNEVGISEEQRDGLRIRDFLRSYEALEETIFTRVNR